MRTLAFTALAAAAACTTACTTVGPDYEAPAAALPASFHQEPSEVAAGPSLEGAEVVLATWWTAFDDPVLTELIARALANNTDLRAAYARIAEAEAQLGVSRALNNPRLDLNADYTRTGITENSQFGLFPGQEREFDSYSLGLAASWELDLWGRAARSIEAAGAELDARAFELYAARVSLAGQVGDAYLRLRALQSRAEVARDDVEVLGEQLETARARYQAGLVQELDVLRASTALQSARATLPQISGLLAQVESELGLLLAAHPGELTELLAVSDEGVHVPTATARLGTQVPADLLRRRPDVRATERALAAETARIGVATADLYPELTLFGSIGLESEKPENLFESGSLVHQLGPRVSMPLFSSGAIRANIAAQDERANQALVAHEASVLAALHEVDAATSAIRWSRAELDALGRAREQAELSLERSRALYTEGLSTIDSVLEARRELVALADMRAQVAAALSRAHIDLFRALGGGWPGEAEQPDA